MSPRPIIFISAVTKELRGARQLVANTLQFLGYEPEWQDIFGTEEGDLRGMLRRRIDGAEGVVQLVGQCYGAEPPEVDAQFGRVSYTQFEALYAHQRGKKVWYLMLDGTFATDAHDPEPEERRALQEAYKQRVRADGHLSYTLNTSDALEAKVLKLRDDLGQLRRGVKRWAIAVVALLVLSVTIGLWLMKSSTTATHKLAEADARLASVEEKMTALLKQGVEKFPQTEAKVRQEHPDQKAAEVEDLTYADLARKLGVDEKELRARLPEFARQLQHVATGSNYERANAAYVSKDYAEAERLGLAAADEAQKAMPPRNADAVSALALAAWSAEKRIHYSDALNYLFRAEKLTDARRDFSEWMPVQFGITLLFFDEGKYHEAERILRGLLPQCAQVLGPQHPMTLRILLSHARALIADGQWQEGERECRVLIPLEEKERGPEDQETLASRCLLAIALNHEGKYVEAEAEYRAVLDLQTKLLGPEHPETIANRNNLASLLDDEGRHAEAEAEHRAVVALFAKILGPEHPRTLMSRYGLADSLKDQRKYQEAESELRAVIALRTKVLGPEHLDTIRSRDELAHVLDDEGRSAEAEAERRAVVALCDETYGPMHRYTLMGRASLADSLCTRGKYAEAEAEYRTLCPLQSKVLGPNDADTLESDISLAFCLARQGKTGEAFDYAQRAVEGARKVLGEDHPTTQRYEKLWQKLQAMK